MQAKYALYEIIFSKIIEYVGGVDPRVSSILEGIHDAHALLIKEITSNYSIENFSNRALT